MWWTQCRFNLIFSHGVDQISRMSVISLCFSSLLHPWPPLFHSFGIWIWEFYGPPRSGVKQYLSSDWWILSSIVSSGSTPAVRRHQIARFPSFQGRFPIVYRDQSFYFTHSSVDQIKILAVVISSVIHVFLSNLHWSEGCWIRWLALVFTSDFLDTYPSKESGTGPHSLSRPSIVLVLLHFKW